MLRKDCTSKTLRESGFEPVYNWELDDIEMPMKDIAYLLREEGFDCKVEIDKTVYSERRYEDFIYMDEVTLNYNYEYMYIRPHGEYFKWRKVAQRKIYI
jgi:hypothetical protein